MSNAAAAKPDTAGLLNLGQVNHAIRPLHIDAKGLAAFGFEPAATHMGAKYYHPAVYAPPTPSPAKSGFCFFQPGDFMHPVHIETAHFHFAPSASPEALGGLERAMQAIGRIGPEIEPIAMQTSSERPVIAIGDYWLGQGGFFAGDFLGDDGRIYGLIVADCGTAQDADHARHCENGERDLSQWDGLENTRRLKNNCPAALLASQHTADGHTDFYLPARRELQLAAANVPHLFGSESWYWTSTPYGEHTAWVVDFDDGYAYHGCRGTEFRVRPFRRFIY